MIILGFSFIALISVMLISLACAPVFILSAAIDPLISNQPRVSVLLSDHYILPCPPSLLVCYYMTPSQQQKSLSGQSPPPPPGSALLLERRCLAKCFFLLHFGHVLPHAGQRRHSRPPPQSLQEYVASSLLFLYGAFPFIFFLTTATLGLIAVEISHQFQSLRWP